MLNQLPDIDGDEAAKRIRASDAPKRPIVAITSYAMAGDEEKALCLGFNGYLTKPINPTTFLREIEKYLSVKGV